MRLQIPKATMSGDGRVTFHPFATPDAKLYVRQRMHIPFVRLTMYVPQRRYMTLNVDAFIKTLWSYPVLYRPFVGENLLVTRVGRNTPQITITRQQPQELSLPEGLAVPIVATLPPTLQTEDREGRLNMRKPLSHQLRGWRRTCYKPLHFGRCIALNQNLGSIGVDALNR